MHTCVLNRVVEDEQAGRAALARGDEAFARGAAPDGAEMFAVNVRCIDDVDLGALKQQHFDGKSL